MKQFNWRELIKFICFVILFSFWGIMPHYIDTYTKLGFNVSFLIASVVSFPMVYILLKKT